MPRVLYTRMEDARTLYNTDATGRPGEFRVRSAGLPGGMSQIFDRSFPPGAKVEWPPRVGEMVVVCTGGTARVVLGDEEHVIREGDTIQFRMDDGFFMEALGDEPSTGYAIFASPGLYSA